MHVFPLEKRARKSFFFINSYVYFPRYSCNVFPYRYFYLIILTLTLYVNKICWYELNQNVKQPLNLTTKTKYDMFDFNMERERERANTTFPLTVLQIRTSSNVNFNYMMEEDLLLLLFFCIEKTPDKLTIKSTT